MSSKWKRTNIYLTEEENNNIKTIAESMNIKKSEYLRYLVHKDMVAHINPRAIFDDEGYTIYDVYTAWRNHRKMIITGGTGTGKTTLMKMCVQRNLASKGTDGDVCDINVYDDDAYELAPESLLQWDNHRFLHEPNFHYRTQDSPVHTGSDDHAVDIIGEIRNTAAARRFVNNGNNTIATMHVFDAEKVVDMLALMFAGEDNLSMNSEEDIVIVHINKHLDGNTFTINDIHEVKDIQS